MLMTKNECFFPDLRLCVTMAEEFQAGYDDGLGDPRSDFKHALSEAAELIKQIQQFRSALRRKADGEFQSLLERFGAMRAETVSV